MVSQLQRSATRKRLTKLCSEGNYRVHHIEIPPPIRPVAEMNGTYLSALKITLGNAVEAITKQELPPHLTNEWQRPFFIFRGG